MAKNFIRCNFPNRICHRKATNKRATWINFKLQQNSWQVIKTNLQYLIRQPIYPIVDMQTYNHRAVDLAFFRSVWGQISIIKNQIWFLQHDIGATTATWNMPKCEMQWQVKISNTSTLGWEYFWKRYDELEICDVKIDSLRQNVAPYEMRLINFLILSSKDIWQTITM